MERKRRDGENNKELKNKLGTAMETIARLEKVVRENETGQGRKRGAPKKGSNSGSRENPESNGSQEM